MFRHQVLHSLVVFWSCCVRFYCFVVGLFLLFVVVHLFVCVCVCVGVVVVFVGVAFLFHAQAGCRSHRVYASVTKNFNMLSQQPQWLKRVAARTVCMRA